MKNHLVVPPQAICLAACLVGASLVITAEPGRGQVDLAQMSLDLDQLTPLSVADSFYQQAADLYEAGDYEQALHLSQRALAIRAARLALDHPAIVSSQRQLATLGDAPPPMLNIENPLIRSGLALAAANPPCPELDTDEDDGLLTALELAGMNLYGTQLVVLSACETGVGDNSSGEGVYGLRRALVMAGVQSQVISLWTVADDSTADLMSDYYQRLLDTENPVGRHEALREAQLAMLHGEDVTRRHPYHWAAFIASGDWRPLEF
jgi:hypothetical protein